MTVQAPAWLFRIHDPRKTTMHTSKLAVAIAAAMGLLSLNAVADQSTTVGGKTYIDFTHIEQKSDGTTIDPSGTGADVKRFYLAIDHKFDDMWSANLTTDFNYVSNDSETQLYVKKAYLQARFSDAFMLRAGSADLPWVPYVENLYGYRYVENTLIDRLKFGTSADWGLHAGGKLADGMFDYSASVVNGNGYKKPARSKAVDFEGRVGFHPMDGVTLAAGYYDGKLGKESYDPGNSTRTASRWDLAGAYQNELFNVGAEYFSAKDWGDAVLTTNPSDKADGYSLWGSVKPMEKVSLFARYDHAKPNKDTAPSLKDTYYNLGVAYKAYKNVDLALVYKHDKVENGTISTSNGSIGGSNDGTYNEVGVFAQVKF
jgi:hypothetical protein